MQEVPEALHFNRTARTAFCDGGFHLLNVGDPFDHHVLRIFFRFYLAPSPTTVKDAHNLAEITQFAPGHRQNGRAWHRK